MANKRKIPPLRGEIKPRSERCLRGKILYFMIFNVRRQFQTGVDQETVMISNFFFGSIRSFFIIIFAGLLFGTFPSGAVSGETASKHIQDDIQPVGIISPDGAKSLWPVSRSRGGDILDLLAKYPSNMLEGVRFYQLSLWKDMARILTAVNEHQAEVIWHLTRDVQQLNKRVANLEQKPIRVVQSRSMNNRVEAMEKQMKTMFDGGYR